MFVYQNEAGRKVGDVEVLGNWNGLDQDKIYQLEDEYNASCEFVRNAATKKMAAEATTLLDDVLSFVSFPTCLESARLLHREIPDYR